MAVREGELPTGRSLEASLDGVKGRVVIFDLCGIAGSADFLQSAARLGLAPQAHSVPLIQPACSDYIAVGAARLVLTSDSPFHLTNVDVQSMLTRHSLPVMIRRMAHHDEEDDASGAIPLTRDDMIKAAVAWGPEEAVAELPWLARKPAQKTQLADSVLEVDAAFARLQETMHRYEEGPPTRHVAIVANTQNQFFACSWQFSLKHMKELEARCMRARSDARGSACAQASASSSATAAAPAQRGVPSMGIGDVIALAQAAVQPVQATPTANVV